MTDQKTDRKKVTKKKIGRKKVVAKKTVKRGRKPKFTEAQKMQTLIDEYFDSVTYEIEGRKIMRPTVEGLAFALNLSRQGLNEYSAKTEFSDTVKRAKQRIAIALETHLWGNNVTGAIFNLKNNFGWKDKTEVEQSGEVKVIGLSGRF